MDDDALRQLFEHLITITDHLKTSAEAYPREAAGILDGTAPLPKEYLSRASWAKAALKTIETDLRDAERAYEEVYLHISEKYKFR